jgi:hypothetical protein
MKARVGLAVQALGLFVEDVGGLLSEPAALPPCLRSSSLHTDSEFWGSAAPQIKQFPLVQD